MRMMADLWLILGEEEKGRQRTEKDQAVISQLVSYFLKNNTVQHAQVNLVTFHKCREATS